MRWLINQIVLVMLPEHGGAQRKTCRMLLVHVRALRWSRCFPYTMTLS